MTKVVEPSEILTGAEQPRSRPPKANPWARCAARLMDYALFCLVLLLWKGGAHANASFFERIIPIEFMAWIPIEAFLLFFWGTTPGKWFLQISLQFGKKKRPDLLTAFQRSASVWWRGLGLGIPVINVLCLWISYQRLLLTKTTSWDREVHSFVLCQPVEKWRLLTAAVGSMAVLALYFS